MLLACFWYNQFKAEIRILLKGTIILKQQIGAKISLKNVRLFFSNRYYFKAFKLKLSAFAYINFKNSAILYYMCFENV